jgi:cobalt-zinc-cadmium efflux system outer membrane protein
MAPRLRSRRRHHAAAWLLFAGACTSLDPAADVASVQRATAERIGVDVPAAPADEPALAAALQPLLQAPLTEASAVQIALLNNRSVRADYERLGIGRAALVQAGLLRNPVFDLDARFLRDGGTNFEASLAQPFLDLFWRPLRERTAAHEFAALQAEVTHDLVDLCFRVRRAFVAVRAAQQVVALQRDALTTAIAGHRLAVELHAAGNVTDQALAAERVAESRARLDLAAAEQAAAEAREPLHALLGVFGADTGWRIDGELAADPLAGLDTTGTEARVVEASLTLQRRAALLDAAAQRTRLTDWRRWLPDGAFGPSAVQEPGESWGFGPRLTLTLPVLDTGAAASAGAHASLREDVLRYGQHAVALRAAARLLHTRTLALADRVRFLRDVHLPHRQQLLTATLQVYNAMQIGVFDVLQARQLQLQDQREYVTTLGSAHLARLDLAHLLAGGTPADVPSLAVAGGL